MKFQVFIFSFIIAFLISFNSVFAKCAIDDFKFGSSSKTIERKLPKGSYQIYNRINNYHKIFNSYFKAICPDLESSLLSYTNLNFVFIRDKLVTIELIREVKNDLKLFEWARKHYGITETRRIDKNQQIIQIDDGEKLIQLFLGILPQAVFQNVLLISKKHDDLFEALSKKEDLIDWNNYEYPKHEPPKS